MKRRRRFMWLWLVISIPFILIALVLLMNQANLMQAPGLKTRLTLFMTSNVAEIKPQAILPELSDCRFPVSQADLYAAVVNSVKQLGWQIESDNAQEFRIQAVVTTALWRFKDDVAVQVFSNAEGSELHARSQSRVGRGDLAANSNHLQKLLAQLDVLKN